MACNSVCALRVKREQPPTHPLRVDKYFESRLSLDAQDAQLVGESEELVTFGIRVHIGMHVSRSKPRATSPQECSEPRE